MFTFLSGCSSNNEANEKLTKLEKEYGEKVTKLETEISETTKKLADSNGENIKLQSELNELKNGAQMTIVEIRKYYNSKNYDKVLELSTKLHNKFLDVPEDKEAQALVKKIKNVKAEEAKKIETAKAKVLAEQSKSAKDKAR